VYVSDRESDLLYIYTSLADTAPAKIDITAPTGLDAVSGGFWFYADNEDFSVVISDNGSSIVKLADGEIVARASLDDCGGSVFNYPAIDFWGNVWVTDSISCSIHKFTKGLDFICTFGSEGQGDREFESPTGLAVWRRFGQVFIAEREGARYFWIGADLENPVIEPTGRGLSIDGTLTEYALVDAMIYDEEGEPVFRLTEGRHQPGDFHLEWEGITSRGVHVPGGDYSLEMVVQPVYSSKGYFSKVFTEDFQIDELDIEPLQ
jgi:hypothetical protein